MNIKMLCDPFADQGLAAMDIFRYMKNVVLPLMDIQRSNFVKEGEDDGAGCGCFGPDDFKLGLQRAFKENVRLRICKGMT